MFICYCAGTVHRPCRECAGTDRAGSVHLVFIVQGPCMECSFVVAWTVQGPCIDCPELNDQLNIFIIQLMHTDRFLHGRSTVIIQSTHGRYLHDRHTVATLRQASRHMVYAQCTHGANSNCKSN